MIMTGATIALVVSAWMAFGPVQLGGSVSYVVTHGISMQPRIHEGDLVIVRRAPTYAHGDVIAFDSAALQQPVMHRIVDGGPKGYVTKGDNNDWLDSDRPTNADVLGKEWLHIPGAGRVLKKVTSPTGAAIMAAIVGLLLFAGGSTKKRRGERGGAGTMRGFDAHSFFELSPTQQILASGVAVVGVLSLLLGIASFAKAPITSLSSEAAYQHTGKFSYSAAAPRGPVYPDGKATTGEPVFLRLIDEVDVAFDYSLKTDADAVVAGEVALSARVEDGTGWRHSFEVAGPTGFQGQSAEIRGTIDPHEIQRLIARVEHQTGVISGSYTVTLMPSVEIDGAIGGESVTERFTPVLNLGLDGQRMNLAAATAETASDGTPAGDPLRPHKEGSLETSQLTANRLSVVGLLEMPIQRARWIAAWGAIASMAGAFALMRSFNSRVLQSREVDRIEARYGTWLIPVATMPATNGEVVKIASIEGLARLAERYDRMILHDSANGTHRYFVEEAGVLYSYEPSQGQSVRTGPPPPPPSGQVYATPPKRSATRSSGAKVRFQRGTARDKTEDVPTSDG